MKIYTEFELAKAYDKGLHDGIFSHISSKSKDTAMKELKPIELPSYEEISDKSALLFPYAKYNQLSIESYNIKAFQQGAKWLKERILNQNK